MEPYIIAYDLGTGGNKASLHDAEGYCLSTCFVPYSTQYPKSGWHEQKPMDWWRSVVQSTQELLKGCDVDRDQIICCGISGHSLGAVPLDCEGRLLCGSTPIWSDSRAGRQAERFFEHVDEGQWYMTTGNGFPAALYTAFKIMWYRENEPEMFEKIHKVIGTKDYINYRLTGRILTDYSYASGSGVYDLLKWDYSDALIEATDLPRKIFPDIAPSAEVIGCLTPEAAEQLGLSQQVRVVCGGVDNSCMALGARAFKEGRVYNSLGSSSWIAVSSAKPLLNEKTRPYVFTHVVPGMFTSATAIFSAGSSFRWLRETLCRNLTDESGDAEGNVYETMTKMAECSPVGANHLLFNPSLAGGSSLDASPNIRGAFIGLDLGHKQCDVIRAVMEGIAMGLRVALDELRKLTQLSDEMVVVGGGSQSTFWRQIYADIYNMRIIKTSIDRQAASLGAAALAAVGSGLWRDFEKIDQIHELKHTAEPVHANNSKYEKMLPVFVQAARYHAELGDMLTDLD
ncbi:MAG: FGGY-family carbohydrate kinase [Phycisphaerae bacterium]|nr:FGGY-family carbohydrate kinase [Phycisphaerae bacterium]